MTDDEAMAMALGEAESAAARGEVPVGAVLMGADGNVLARYVTLEPCAMCAGAASLARVTRIVFAADDPKGGAVLHGPRVFEQPTCHHRPIIARAGDAEAVSRLLKGFFRARRL